MRGSVYLPASWARSVAGWRRPEHTRALSRRVAPWHLKVVVGPFHDGEREMQARAGVREEADAVGRIIRNTIPPAAARFLAMQRLAVATTLDPGGRVWASLLTGEPGFIRAVDETLLRVQARPVPGDPLPDNLATQPWLGLLVLDPQTRGRMPGDIATSL